MIVYIGRKRFVEFCQRENIQSLLYSQYGIVLSTGEISLIAKDFLLYLAALHRQHAPALRTALRQDGGWPMHVDATGEDGQGTLLVVYAGWRRWVLGVWKIPTERADAILPRMQEMNQLFGAPCSIMRDLGKAMIDATEEFAGSALDLLGPYPLLVGALAVALCAMHGSIFLYLKTEGELQRRIHGFLWRTFFVFLALYLAVSVATLLHVPHATHNFERWPWAWVVVGLNVLAVANIPRAIHLGRPGHAFVSSCCTVAALDFLFGRALYPNLLVSSLDPAYSLDLYNSAASQKTLGIMRTITFIRLPFVVTYAATVYCVFRGKTKLDETSY